MGCEKTEETSIQIVSLLKHNQDHESSLFVAAIEFEAWLSTQLSPESATNSL
jgi:hypothetical protein